MNKTVIIVLVIVIIGALAYMFMGKSKTDAPEMTAEEHAAMEEDGAMMEDDKMMEEDGAMTEKDDAMMESAVKEFSMDSFVVFEDDKPKPQFSIKEITVNKGDTVRLNINTTSGTHDFKIDELDVFADTPTDEVTVVEFVATEAGEFVYYCNQPGHRANGHWGTLIVK